MKNRHKRLLYKLSFIIFIFLFPLVYMGFIIRIDLEAYTYLFIMLFELIVVGFIYSIVEIRLFSYFNTFKKRLESLKLITSDMNGNKFFGRIMFFDTLANIEYFFSEELEIILSQIDEQKSKIQQLEIELYNKYNIKEYQLKSAVQELNKLSEKDKKKEEYMDNLNKIIENIENDTIEYENFFNELLYYVTSIFGIENAVLVKLEANDTFEIICKNSKNIIFDAGIINKILLLNKRVIIKNDINTKLGFDMIIKIYLKENPVAILLIASVTSDIHSLYDIRTLENFSLEISSILLRLNLIEKYEKEKELLQTEIKTLKNTLYETEKSLDIQLEQITDMYEEIVTLYEAGKVVVRMYDIKEIEKLMLEMILEIIDAEIGFVYYYNSEKSINVVVSKIIYNKFELDISKEIKKFLNESNIPQVIKIGKTEVVVNKLQNSEYYDKFSEEVRGQLHNLVVIPIFHGKDVSGGLVVLNKDRKQDFSSANIKLMTALTNQLAMSVQNIEFLEKEIELKKEEEQLKIASEIEAKLFPQEMPTVKNFDFYGLNVPAKSVGGDYFDLIKIDENNVIGIIADVAGKGIPAALLVSMFRTIFRMLVNQIKFTSPGKILSNINNQIVNEDIDGRFITSICFRIDVNERQMIVANAGHTPLLIYRAETNSTEECNIEGTVLGVMEDEVYDEETIVINKGDSVLLYTDGVVEARSGTGDFFELDRLIEILKSNNKYPSDFIARKIYRDIVKFLGNSVQNDDITILTVKGG